MNFNKALELFGLKPGYTEEELKQARNKLAVKYHPDNYKEGTPEYIDAETMMKEINSGYEILSKHQKESSLSDYREQIKNKINSYWENCKIADTTLFLIVCGIAETSASLLPFRLKKEEIDMVFQDFLQELKKVYQGYLDQYFSQNYIYKEDIKEEIKYDCNVEEFYEQVQKFYAKYSRKIYFSKRIDEETYKYQSYSTYTDYIGELISTVVKHNAEINARKINYKDFDIVMQKAHQEIEEIFNFVDKINDLLSKLNEIIKNLKNDELLKEYNDIKENYKKGTALEDVLSALERLDRKVEEIKSRQEEVETNKDEINILYQNVYNRYFSFISTLDPIKDNDKIKNATQLLMTIIQKFTDYYNGLMSFEELKLIEQISFIDLDADLDIFNTQTEEISGTLENDPDLEKYKLKIYLRRPVSETLNLDDCDFYALTKDDDDNYYIDHVGYTSKMQRKVTIEELDKDFISLDECLKDANFIGKKAIFNKFFLYSFLYKLPNNRALCIKNGFFTIVNIDNLNIDSLYAGEAIPYKDKEYMKMMIIGQCEKLMDKRNPDDDRRGR